MDRPLVPVALLYTCGLLLAAVFHPPLWLLWTAALLLAGAGLLSLPGRHWWLAALLIVAGWTNLSWRTAILSPHDLRLLLGETPHLVTIQGRLLETPSERIYVREEKEFSRSLARLQVARLKEEGKNWQTAEGRLLVTTRGALPAGYFDRQWVEVTGVILPPPRAVAEGLFDYRAYLRHENIHYQLKVDSTNEWRRLSNQGAPMGDRFLAWAKSTLARGLPAEDLPLQLLWAMTLGWKAGLTNEVYEPFMRSGTMHIFAISGLHIALIAGLLVSFLRVLQVPRGACGLVVIPLIWFYTAATGWQPSAIRSTVMMTVVIGGWSLRRPSDLLNSLAASALIILLWDPQQLFGASFQLSFFVVLSIALLVPPLEAIRDRWLQTDPLLPEELLPAWRRHLRLPLRWFTTSLATSIAAWLGSLPLVAYYFHLFSPVTLLANLVIVPLSSLALACNLGSLICGPWLPWLSEYFNHSAWWWMQSMVWLSQWSTHWSSSYFYVRSPSPVVFAIYYSLLIGSLSGWLFARQHRLRAAFVILLAGGFLVWEWQTHARTARLNILPLGSGTAIYSAASSQRLLVDCGSRDSAQFTTLSFLRAQGVNRLPALMLTHGDIQHAGGAPLIDDAFAVGKILISPVRFLSAPYNKTVESLRLKRRPIEAVAGGASIGPWKLLHPQAGEAFPRADDKTMVLSANLRGTEILLLSDLGRLGQDALLQRHTNLAADIVVSGLPAEGEPLGDALLDRVNPQLIIVTDDEFPSWEHARPALQQRLARRQVPVIYTRSAGAVTLEFRNGCWKLRSMNGTSLVGQPRGKDFPERGTSRPAAR